MYSDDILISGRTKTECLQKAKKVMTLLQECNFTINMKNSILGPTQQIEFLGLILDSIQMKVFLPEPKVLDLIESSIISDSKVFSKSSREDEFLSPGSSSCPDLLQGNSGRHPPSNRQNQQFQQKTDFVIRGQIRNTVVDSQCTPVEWASCNKHKTQGRST